MFPWATVPTFTLSTELGWLTFDNFIWSFAKSFIFHRSNIGTLNLNCLKTTHQSLNLSLQLCIPCSDRYWPVVSNPQAASELKAWLSDPVLVYFCTLVPSRSTGYTETWDQTFPHLGLEFCLIASMLLSWERADTDALCCSRDFLSLTVASLVLAMSIALSSFNYHPFLRGLLVSFVREYQ